MSRVVGRYRVRRVDQLMKVNCLYLKSMTESRNNLNLKCIYLFVNNLNNVINVDTNN